jgi:hypothetical protein
LFWEEGLVVSFNFLQSLATFNHYLSLFGVMVFDDLSRIFSHPVKAENAEEYEGESHSVHAKVASNEP